MMKDPEIQYENYQRYKKGETRVAWVVTFIIVTGILLTIFPWKSYPPTNTHEKAATHTCTTDVLRMPDFPPTMTPLCISKDQR